MDEQGRDRRPARNVRWRVPFDPGTALIGLVAGLLNGLIGIGGGIVMVPGLILRRGVEVRAAVATSLAAVSVLSSCAFLLHLAVSGFSLSAEGTVVVMGAGIVGAQIGAWLLNHLPRRLVMLIFAALTLFTASRLVFQALGWVSAPIAAPHGPPFWGYPLFGVISGIFSGLLGIGGGAFVLLGFSVFFDTPIQGGLPIALALNVTNALSGAWAQRRTGHILWDEVIRLAPAALVGIAIGGALAILLPADVMRAVFGAFFLYMAGRLFYQTLKF